MFHAVSVWGEHLPSASWTDLRGEEKQTEKERQQHAGFKELPQNIHRVLREPGFPGKQKWNLQINVSKGNTEAGLLKIHER